MQVRANIDGSVGAVIFLEGLEEVQLLLGALEGVGDFGLGGELAAGLRAILDSAEETSLRKQIAVQLADVKAEVLCVLLDSAKAACSRPDPADGGGLGEASAPKVVVSKGKV